MFYDEELPGGFQDADFEMRELEEAAAQATSQRKRGICQHLSAVGYLPTPVYPEQVGLKPGEVVCTDGCGQVFVSDDAWFEAMRDARYA